MEISFHIHQAHSGKLFLYQVRDGKAHFSKVNSVTLTLDQIAALGIDLHDLEYLDDLDLDRFKAAYGLNGEGK